VRAISTTFVLQLAVIYVPIFQGALTTVSLTVTDLLIAILASLVVLLMAEVVKWFIRRNKPVAI
jgi:Ca2+-transporting ATPase